MNKTVSRALLAAAVALGALGAHSARADDNVRETRPVDAGVARVQLGGVIQLAVHQGAVPALVLSGERRLVAQVTTTQRGNTLVIDMEPHARIQTSGRNALRADLTVPNLQEFVSQGVGSTEISGFKGKSLKVSLEGAGAVRVTGQYRDVEATLGGIGGLTLNPGQAERVALHLGGAGHITVAGQTRLLRVELGGIGSLDAQQLHADSVDLDMAGLGGASVYARSAANINLSGMGAATVYGKPATRHASTNGFGRVSWE
jgi:hypothetical protein